MRLIWQSRTVCLLSRARTLRVCVFLSFVVNNFKAGVSVDCPLIIRFIISSKEGLWSWQPHARPRLQSKINANTHFLFRVCVFQGRSDTINKIITSPKRVHFGHLHYLHLCSEPPVSTAGKSNHRDDTTPQKCCSWNWTVLFDSRTTKPNYRP